MPSRNVVKINLSEYYYHVYTRGIGKQNIFFDEADYLFFLSLFERYLSTEDLCEQVLDKHQKINNSVELLAYCLMPNHFHLLLHQIGEDGVSKLMHGIMANYSRYFNQKYGRSGPLFDSKYEALPILSDDYLLHISRYIHLNHDKWLDYPYSSIRAYLYDDVPSWLNKLHIAKLSSSAVKYLEFLEDYQEDQSKIIN